MGCFTADRRLIQTLVIFNETVGALSLQSRLNQILHAAVKWRQDMLRCIRVHRDDFDPGLKIILPLT